MVAFNSVPEVSVSVDETAQRVVKSNYLGRMPSSTHCTDSDGRVSGSVRDDATAEGDAICSRSG